MINLIPPDARTRITTEYWARVVTVWLFLLAVAAVLAGAFLLPSYVLVTSQVRSFAVEAEAAKASVAHSDGTARVLVIAGDQARLLREGEQMRRFTDLMAAVSAAAGAGIDIREYSFSRAAGVVTPVQVGGVAATRQSLAVFRDALRAEPTFAAVDLPISNFAKDRDIEFSLSLTIASSTPTP